MTTKQPDWEAIERAYRAGLLSIREIASTQGITHGAINKRAKRDGWERNLKAKIQAKADALVSKRTVSTEVSTKQADTVREIIEVNAEAIVAAIQAHAAEEYPRECCGLLLAVGRAQKYFPCRNTATEPQPVRAALRGRWLCAGGPAAAR
jgi:hypothetical protein